MSISKCGFLLLCLFVVGLGGCKESGTAPSVRPTKRSAKGFSMLKEALAKATTPAQRGKLWMKKFGCFVCHSVDGTRKVGPTLKGIVGKEVVLQGGKKMMRDAAYLRRKILRAGARLPLVKGFPPVHPSFAGRIDKAKLNAMIAYLRGLSPVSAVAKRPVRRRPKPVDFRKYLRKPPKGFVDLREAVPGIRLSVRYHTKDNFTGAPLPGYGAPGAWMLEEPAAALKRVQASLQKKGMGLLVYDAYRPYRGTLGMVAWAKRTRQLDLFKKGYIARYSGHNHGHTVDLTIVDAKTHKPLDMGTPWDTLNTKSHTRNAKGKALKNRLLLLREMRKQGFRPYYKEWWHFRYKMKRKTRARDVPYGCYEAPERKWRPAKGWDRPGFKMPMQWTPKPCK